MVDIADIVGGLTGRIEALAGELLPRGERQGNDWVEASRAKGGLGDSLKVCIRGPRAGVWAFFGGELHGIDRGDALDLVAALATEGNKGRAIVWSKRWLGLEGGDPKTIKADRAAAAKRSKAGEAAAAAELTRKRNQAMAIWRAGQKIRATLAEAYLAGRGIDFGALARYPRSLRYVPELHEPEQGRYLPALVACITLANGEFAGVHRTWLSNDGAGQVIKHPDMECPKMTLGSYRGGAIRLWRGAAKRYDTAPAVVVTEGIEDGLTVAMAAPERTVLCSVSLSNLAALELWGPTEQVTVLADNDAPGSQADKLLRRALLRFQAQQFAVEVCRASGGAKDINEMLQQTSG